MGISHQGGRGGLSRVVAHLWQQGEIALGANRILIVDSSDSIRFLLARTFEASGFKCVGVGDAVAAAEAVESEAPDLVILDQLLPGRLGTEVLRQWRSEGASFPVIMISSATSDQTVVEAFRLGASDFVRKPFSPIELVERVRHQLSLAVRLSA